MPLRYLRTAQKLVRGSVYALYLKMMQRDEEPVSKYEVAGKHLSQFGENTRSCSRHLLHHSSGLIFSYLCKDNRTDWTIKCFGRKKETGKSRGEERKGEGKR